MNCPHCKKPILAKAIASSLGKMGAGKPKNYGVEEKRLRGERLAKVRKLRHKKKDHD